MLLILVFYCMWIRFIDHYFSGAKVWNSNERNRGNVHRPSITKGCNFWKAGCHHNFAEGPSRCSATNKWLVGLQNGLKWHNVSSHHILIYNNPNNNSCNCGRKAISQKIIINCLNISTIDDSLNIWGSYVFKS